MANKQLVMIVNGYGCHTSFEDPEQDRFLEGYRRYLERVTRFIITHLPKLIILSGGSTQKKSAPGKTEASVMWQYVYYSISDEAQKYYDDCGQIVLEEKSFTTYGNSFYTQRNLTSAIVGGLLRKKPCQIVHFCEAQRAANVNMCDRHFLARFVERIDDIRTETESWELADPFLQVKNLVYNQFALKYPWLGLAEREERRRIARSYHI